MYQPVVEPGHLGFHHHWIGVAFFVARDVSTGRSIIRRSQGLRRCDD